MDLVVVTCDVCLKGGGPVNFLIIYESKAAGSCILFEWLLSSKTQLIAGDRDHKLIDRMGKRPTMREYSSFPTGITASVDIPQWINIHQCG